MSETWLVDPTTGDYVMDDNGKPTLDVGLKVPSYLRLKTRRNTWLYAPDTDYGSDFHKIGRRLTTKDNFLVESIVERALQPILDDGRASKVIVEPKEYTRHTAELNVGIKDAQGEIEQLDLVPIGVR